MADWVGWSLLHRRLTEADLKETQYAQPITFMVQVSQTSCSQPRATSYPAGPAIITRHVRKLTIVNLWFVKVGLFELLKSFGIGPSVVSAAVDQKERSGS